MPALLKLLVDVIGARSGQPRHELSRKTGDFCFFLSDQLTIEQ
jgi:hypothetical protein